MRRCELCGELFLRRLRPLAVDKLKEIKPNPDSIDANQIGYVLDVIDVTIERALFFLWTHEHGIYADHAAPFADHLDLLVADVALDVVVAPDVRVRNDGRLCRHRQNLVETRLD